MTNNAKGTPLPDEERHVLRALAEQRGTRQACADLAIAPATLARAIAGLPITRAITTHLRVKIAAPEATK